MKWKTRLTIPLLFTLFVLSQSLTTPSSATALPHIYVTPSSIIDTGLTPNDNFTISIETNYTGNEIWGWELTLTYNPLVLEGLAVVNGNITVNATHPATFSAGTFNNTLGELSLTGAFFDVETNATGVVKPVNVTSGPGILANVTFKVVGTGDTPITLGSETKLVGWSQGGYGDVYEIVDAQLMSAQIGHGYFRNTAYHVVHDVAVLSGSVNDTTPYERYRNVSINATVQNQGNVTEKFEVSIYWHFISENWLIHRETVQLASQASQLITTTWVTLGWHPGIGNVTVVATQVWNETDTADNQPVIASVNLRIPGDIDGNGHVVTLDKVLFKGWFPDLTPPPADPDCDIDGDGDIDDLDYMILLGNIED